MHTTIKKRVVGICAGSDGRDYTIVRLSEVAMVYGIGGDFAIVESRPWLQTSDGQDVVAIGEGAGMIVPSGVQLRQVN